ncbi:MAG: response regulator transcription factor [Ruminococcus sp.]|jgi:two-component system OmpR family response regulator
MYTVAVIDDDVYVGDMLERVLKKEGYEVLRAYSGTEALMLLSRIKPDLVLLDLMLPGCSGEEVLPGISDIPVIVISARSEISDRVEMLLKGADDYLTKPFDTKELLARITVQLRKKEHLARRKHYVFQELEVDDDLHEVKVDGCSVRLTRTEYAILKLLIQNPRQVITKSVMLERISQDTPDCVESSLKVHVSNLRRKLREIKGRDYIESVWGIGFKLREETC